MGLKQSEDLSEPVEGMIELDEGWWSSILADENAAVSPRNESIGRNTNHSTIHVDWNKIKSYLEGDEIIELDVYGFNRGGLLVQCDHLQGFVPISHLVDFPCNPCEEEKNEALGGYVGHQLRVKVIECEPSQERVVLSERAALAGEGRRRYLLKNLRTGEVIEGLVTNITEFGAFVDLGGVEGLIHVSELSWGRVTHPSDVLKVGQTISTMVLQVTEESARVALSLKRLCANPWEQISRNYRPGDVVTATITDIMRFGAFARMDEGVEGLIHISSMDLPPGKRQIDHYLKSGQVVKVRILHIDAERRRLGLGLVSNT